MGLSLQTIFSKTRLIILFSKGDFLKDDKSMESTFENTPPISTHSRKVMSSSKKLAAFCDSPRLSLDSTKSSFSDKSLKLDLEASVFFSKIKFNFVRPSRPPQTITLY